jgi:predicted patatin/cPLA2 family phospholipase
MNKKIAIVCSGGGMRCGYTGGVLVALAREHNLTSPDIIIAGSGSAGLSLYYLTQQYEAIKKIAVELLSTPKFISFLRLNKIMDIDYLIDIVFKKQQPLDLEKLSLTKSFYYIPIKNTGSGEMRYFSNNDSVNVFEVLRATKAIPFFCKRKILLDGSSYADGSTFSQLKKMIVKAIELGADKVLVIDCRTLMSKLPKYKDGQVFVISNPKIPSKLLTRDAKKLQKTYDMGYSDVINNKDLAVWLKDQPTL